MSIREVYRLADLAQLFFDATTYKAIVDQFEGLRLEALELLVAEEKARYAQRQGQYYQPMQQVPQ